MQVLFAHRRAIWEGCGRQRVFTFAAHPLRLCMRQRRGEPCNICGMPQADSTEYAGIKRTQKFKAGVKLEGIEHFAGYFANEAEAAYSFDAKLREVCRDPLRLKKSLNFPPAGNTFPWLEIVFPKLGQRSGVSPTLAGSVLEISAGVGIRNCQCALLLAGRLAVSAPGVEAWRFGPAAQILEPEEKEQSEQ